MVESVQPQNQVHEPPSLPRELEIALRAITLPEVQEMMRKLSAYNLGVYMPHMHDKHTGAMQVLPEGMFQVEDDLKVSFQRTDPPESTYIPVAWVWRDGLIPGAKCASICMTVHHAP